MAETVRRVDYVYATVPDAPGEGERVLSALADAGVNLLAYLGFPAGGDRSQLDLVTDDASSLRAALDAAGVSTSETKQAFLVQGEDRAGAVEATTRKLADAGINATAAAAVGDGSGRYGMILWVAAEDYDRAAAALGANEGETR